MGVTEMGVTDDHGSEESRSTRREVFENK